MRKDATALCSLGSALLMIGVVSYVAARRSSDQRSVGRGSAATVTDFDAELSRIDQQIAACSSAETEQRATQFAFLRHLRASLTGDPASFRSIARAIKAGVDRFGPSADLCLLKASLDLKFHRLTDAKDDLNSSVGLPRSNRGRALLADVDFQEGRCEAAGAGYESVVANDRTWDNLARLAYFKSKTGDFLASDRTYCDAVEEIWVKDVRSYAWVQLQHGLSYLSRGRYDEAGAAYDRAARAYSGYWLVDEYSAELLAARKRFVEAVALYLRVIALAARPEINQELGDVYVFMGRPDLAKPWHDRALAGYLASVARGEVQYFHHLAGFYADSRQDAPEAIGYAERDLQLRQNYLTEDALSWALYRAGRFTEAEQASGRALAYGMIDPHILFHAAMIRLAAGHTEEGRGLLRQTAEINPRYGDFHVHR